LTTQLAQLQKNGGLNYEKVKKMHKMVIGVTKSVLCIFAMPETDFVDIQSLV
jgi:hypothetical protein